MYHIGKVLNVLKSGKEVVSCDDSVQAVAEMWDKNILTFLVDPKISGQLKKADFVLVDYKPIGEKIPVPRHIIVKILKGKTAEEVWKEYKKYFADKHKKAANSQIQPPTMVPQYLG